MAGAWFIRTRVSVRVRVRASVRFIVRFRHFQVQKIRRSARPHFTRGPLPLVLNNRLYLQAIIKSESANFS